MNINNPWGQHEALKRMNKNVGKYIAAIVTKQKEEAKNHLKGCKCNICSPWWEEPKDKERLNEKNIL